MFTVDNFWDIFTAASGETVDGMTEVLDSLAKDAKAKGQLYFDFVLGGAPPTNENDWLRLRAFLLDWYASHQTIGSATSKITDPRTLSNSDIDELFRSFGYNYSPQLKGHDENPTDLKINFFLDLVNLYKRKGTPQAIVEVLQYYGVTKVDVYEFFIKLKNANSLIFEGTAVAGTTTNPSKLIFEYERLTADDPHWLYTEEQILQLQQTNDINLPSKTPYLGVRPVAAIDGAEIGILIRLVQDQFQYYLDNGVPPEANAEVSEIGEVVSLLELYLSVLYVFIKQYNVGQTGDSFICYDGTSSIITDIVDEFETATTKPTVRAEILSGLTTFYDGFTRENPRNFLQNKTDAEMFLTLINPSLKASLDSTTLTDSEMLFSLMKDLSTWVRINLGYGFVNMGFIMFGLDSFFDDLKPVINFFKPYRARLLLLELLQISNPLFNTIIVEDDPEVPRVEFPIYDWLTANGNPCCTEENIDSTGPCTICLEDSTSNLYYARETYDCGSYHDIGAVSDIRQTDFFPFIEEIRHISLVCIPPDLDSTSIVYNEVLNGSMVQDGTSTIIVTDSTAEVDELIYEEVTTGGFANFDGEQGDPSGYVYDPADGTSVIATLYENHLSGKFDCKTAFDAVFIQVYNTSSSSSSTSSSSSSSSSSISSSSSSTSAAPSGFFIPLDQGNAGGSHTDVFDDGTFVYATASGSGLHSYSVNPSTGEITHIDTDYQGVDNYQGVWGDGNFIYVAVGTDGIKSYSVDGSGLLTYIVNWQDEGGTYYGVWGDGTYIYAVAELDGILSYSVDGSGNLTHIDTDDTYAPSSTGHYFKIHKATGFIYVAGSTSGMYSYDIT